MILVLFYHDAPYVEAKQTHIPDVEKLKLRNAYTQMSVCLRFVCIWCLCFHGDGWMLGDLRDHSEHK